MDAKPSKHVASPHLAGSLSVLSELFAQRNDSALRSNSPVDLGVTRLNYLFRRPISLVSAKTTCLTPLVFKNESYVWPKRRNT